MADPEKVDTLRISAAARDDIDGIWRFTANRWSTAQADDYILGLETLFDEIVDRPYGPRERAELTPPRRIRHYKSHIVIYRIDGSVVLVDRILHNHRNWSSILTKED